MYLHKNNNYLNANFIYSNTGSNPTFRHNCHSYSSIYYNEAQCCTHLLPTTLIMKLLIFLYLYNFRNWSMCLVKRLLSKTFWVKSSFTLTVMRYGRIVWFSSSTFVILSWNMIHHFIVEFKKYYFLALVLCTFP